MAKSGEAAIDSLRATGGHFKVKANGSARGIDDGILRNRVRDATYRRALALVDLIAALSAVSLAVTVMHGARLPVTALILLPLITLVAKLIGLYDHDNLVLHKSTLDESPLLFAMATVFALSSTLLDRPLFDVTMSHGEIGMLWISLFATLLGGRIGVRTLVPRFTEAERCLLIGDPGLWDKLSYSLAGRRGASLESHLQLRSIEQGRRQSLSSEIAGSMDRLRTQVRQNNVHRIIIALDESGLDEILDCILVLEGLGVKVSVVPSLLEVVGSAVQFEDIDGLPVLGVKQFGLSRSSSSVKRCFDVCVGAIALVLSAPLFVAVAIAIKRSSQGPVFFLQRRVGRDGKQFHLIKFRTMYQGASRLQAELAHLNETDGLFKIADDPRVTGVGRFLRRISLDELPQLINVVRGEMSLVGPRPLVPAEDEKIRGWARRRLHLTPGMTGNWQILGAARVPLDQMVKIDYLYIANWSLWSDIKALLRTLPHIIGQRGL